MDNFTCRAGVFRIWRQNWKCENAYWSASAQNCPKNRFKTRYLHMEDDCTNEFFIIKLIKNVKWKSVIRVHCGLVLGDEIAAQKILCGRGREKKEGDRWQILSSFSSERQRKHLLFIVWSYFVCCTHSKKSFNDMTSCLLRDIIKLGKTSFDSFAFSAFFLRVLLIINVSRNQRIY